MKFGDHFEGQIYYIETMDLFHLIDRNAKPNMNDLVAVERLPTRQIVIERYRGQPFFGVVRVLKQCQLTSPKRGFYRIIRSILLAAGAAPDAIMDLLDLVPDPIDLI